MSVIVNALAILGAATLITWVVVCALLVRGDRKFQRAWRASKTARPSASSRVVDGRTLGLVSMPPGREQPAPIPPQDAGTTRPGRAYLKGTK